MNIQVLFLEMTTGIKTYENNEKNNTSLFTFSVLL